VAGSVLGDLVTGVRAALRRDDAPDDGRTMPPVMSGMVLEAPGEPTFEELARSTSLADFEAALRWAARRRFLTTALDLVGLALVPVGVGLWVDPGAGLVVGGAAVLWLSSRLAR